MKLLKLYLIVLITFTAVVNAQIPNNGFEIWENYPDDMNPNNVYSKPEMWLGLLPNSPSTYSFSIEKNNDNYPIGTGQYSMLIKNDLLHDVNGIALSYDVFPPIDLKANWFNLPPSFPISIRPSYFCLYYKYIPINGDSMKAACYFYKSGLKIGEAIHISSESTSEWTPLMIPVNFSTNDIPDSALIVFTVANNLNYQHDGSKLYLDNMSFENLITSINKPRSELSNNFQLSQNYPNPFNPRTKIQYSIPQRSHVTINVCDILGKELINLVNEEKEIGNYEIEFDGSNLSSGVYFYRMLAGNFVNVKRLTLLK